MKRPSLHLECRFAQLSLLALSALGLPSLALAQAPADVEIEAAPPAPKSPATPAPVRAPLPAPAASASAPTPSPTEIVPAPVAEPTASKAELEALRAELDGLTQKLLASEAARAEQAKLDEQRRAEAARSESERATASEQRSLLDRVAKLGVTVSGYLQAQYGQNQISEDQLLQGGAPINQDRFAIRRGRLRVKGRWKYLRTDFEVDASTTRGPSTSVRRASVSGVLPSSDPNALPLLVLSVGLTEIPIGRELQQGQDEILFLERTTGSLALFSGPVDTGARLDGAYGPLRAQLAIMNGTPIDDRAGGPSAVDAVRAPDFLGRVGFASLPLDYLRIEGGVSFLTGKGFHAGSDATKPVLQWDDSNADGTINAGELVAVAGRGALPSVTFKHWAVAADLDFELRTELGWSRLYGEVTLASNLDRALYVADPVERGNDVRELSWYVAAVQDITPWAFVGLRYDEYDPNSDLTDNRRGESVPADATIKTTSPIIGGRWPGYGRVTFEYDLVKDKLARDVRGVPTDVKNNQWTLRFQGEF
jgi:hypothetical protein